MLVFWYQNAIAFLSRYSCIPFFQPIVPVEVYQVIQNQNFKKAAGPENIPNKFLKIVGEWRANFLSEYFNKYLEHRCFLMH